MDKITCPKCGSTNVQKQAEYAALERAEGGTKPHIVPNECREENCRHKWYNEE